MSISIKSNIAAQTAQRFLGVSGRMSAESLAKISSGSRVVKAKDDAAALAIGSKLGSEVSALRQASLNASQAGSMMQIADGALAQTSDILTRMKSLAVQSASGQLSDTERTILNSEFVALRTEVDRIAQNTNFNGVSLINGGGKGAVLENDVRLGQFGAAGVEAVIDPNVVTTGDVFRITYDYTDVTDASTPGDTDTYNLTVRNITQGTSQTIELRDEWFTKLGSYAPATNLSTGTRLEVSFATLGVTLNLNENFNKDGDIDVTTTVATNDASGAMSATVSGLVFGNTGVTNAMLTTIKGLAGYTASTGVLELGLTATGTNTAKLDAVTGLRFQRNSGTIAADNATLAGVVSGDRISVYDAGGTVKLFEFDTTAVTDADGTGDLDIAVTLPGLTRGVSFSSGAATKDFAFQIGAGTGASDTVTFTLNAANLSALSLGSNVITTSSNATTAITAVNAAINTLNTARAGVGAAQSRLEFATANLSSAIENNDAARSSLLDADVSSEMTRFTSQQVLLQAGISMLAQANQQPALLLRLLQ